MTTTMTREVLASGRWAESKSGFHIRLPILVTTLSQFGLAALDGRPFKLVYTANPCTGKTSLIMDLIAALSMLGTPVAARVKPVHALPRPHPILPSTPLVEDHYTWAKGDPYPEWLLEPDTCSIVVGTCAPLDWVKAHRIPFVDEVWGRRDELDDWMDCGADEGAPPALADQLAMVETFG